MKLSRFSGVRAVGVAVVAALGVAACTPVGVVAGAGATAGTAAVDERGIVGTATDVRIRGEINGAWARIDPFAFSGVGLLIRGGRVVLTGTVETEERYRQAVETVKAVKGVTDIYVHIRVAGGGVLSYASDAGIVFDMRRAIFLDKSIVSLNYDIDASGQTLYLLGIAQDDSERQRVLIHARRISGVRQIVDYIILKEEYQALQGQKPAPSAPAAAPEPADAPEAPMPLQPLQPPVRTAPVEVQPL